MVADGPHSFLWGSFCFRLQAPSILTLKIQNLLYFYFFWQLDVISRWPCVRCVVSQQHDYIELVCTATYIEGSLVRVHTTTTAFPTQDSRSRCGFALHPTSPLHWLLMAWRLWNGDAPAHPIDERCIHCLYGNPRGWIPELASCYKPTSPSLWSCWELWFCNSLFGLTSATDTHTLPSYGGLAQ